MKLRRVKNLRKQVITNGNFFLSMINDFHNKAKIVSRFFNYKALLTPKNCIRVQAFMMLVAVLLLAGLPIKQARADDCWFDDRGDMHCPPAPGSHSQRRRELDREENKNDVNSNSRSRENQRLRDKIKLDRHLPNSPNVPDVRNPNQRINDHQLPDQNIDDNQPSTPQK